MTGDVAALLGEVGAGLFQQAWVVPDMAVAEAAMRETMGCGAFLQLEMTESWVVRGREQSSTLKLAFARTGDMQLELIQPVDGASLHMEFLESHGGGFHHLGALVSDLNASVEAAGEHGFDEVMSGGFGSLRLCYLDTFAALGAYVELIEDPDRILWTTCPWRDDAS